MHTNGDTHSQVGCGSGIRSVVHSSEGCWFDALHLHIEVSLGEILNPKQPPK